MKQPSVPGDTGRTVALDCRWLSYSGAGRLTEMLLRGLGQAPPPQRWLIWGPPETASYTWPGSDHIAVSSQPTRLSGQREWFAIPPADLVIFLHQQRPLRRVAALSMVLDTTPVRYNRNRIDAWAKLRFLRRVAEVSKGVITISEFSKRCIERDLRVDPERITRLDLPADADLAGRVLSLRGETVQEEVALYVGLFLPHKNLPRLIQAFGRTSFRQRGGRLVLVGGKDAAGPLRQSLDADQRSFVTVLASCTQDQLERLYATSRFLVQPSLEEGFGLPVQEALTSGLPVCASNGGALPEVTHGLAQHFEATSVQEMAIAIDRTSEIASETGIDCGHALSASYLARSPSLEDLARQVVDLVERHLP